MTATDSPAVGAVGSDSVFTAGQPIAQIVNGSADLRQQTDEAVALLGTRLRSYMPDADLSTVHRAYFLAKEAHCSQQRASGEPYIDHPVAVAHILLDLKLDTASVAAALLHDVVEDTAVSLLQIQQAFGAEIAHLVDGVTKLSVLEEQNKEEAQAGSYRKMFIAMAADPRVVLIKLADRLHNMRTLDAFKKPEKQRRIAKETLEIYAPLAHRLGIWQVKWELEDLSFRYLNPEKYHEISQQLALRREAREKIVQRVIARLKGLLEKEGIQAQITGRPKHIYSIYRKMERKSVSLDEVYDQLAVRVIVEGVGDCYRVLGIVHGMWTPIMSEFDDYIAVPKESMYRSLHTTVIIPGGQPCEVQIRTQEMHDVAEHGIAAHWRYKEGFGRNSDTNFEAKLAWLRGLIEWRRELADAKEFVESLKSDVFEEQVYVMSPRGQIVDLPEGSTPVDFAYRIHSEVGHNCGGAKVNNRMVPLDYQLQNGEMVQIITAKNSRGPSRDWLNFVKTSGARNHIRRFFRRQLREENLSAGRDMLEKELKRLGLKIAFDDIARAWGVKSIDDLFVLIGSGETTARQVAHKVISQRHSDQDELSTLPQVSSAPKRDPEGIQVRGANGILTRVAKCCSPIVGEPVVGYVTRGRGVTVHRADCRTVLDERSKDRLIEVTWGSHNPQGSPVPVRIDAWDRVGLWRDIAATIADADINIQEVQQVASRKTGRAALIVTLTIETLPQLTMILDKLNRIPDVIDARRDSSGTVTAA